MNIKAAMTRRGRALGSWNPARLRWAAAATHRLALAIGRPLAASRSPAPLVATGLAALAALCVLCACLGAVLALIMIPCWLARDGIERAFERGSASPRGKSIAGWALAALALAAGAAEAAGVSAAWLCGAPIASALLRSLALGYAINPRLAPLARGPIAPAIGLNPYALLCGLRPSDPTDPPWPSEAECSPGKLSSCSDPMIALSASQPCGLLGGWAMRCSPSATPLESIKAKRGASLLAFDEDSAWISWAESLAEGHAISLCAGSEPSESAARRLRL